MNNYWKKRAKTYNKLKWVHRKEWLTELIKFSRIRKTDKVLDLGCGTGVIAQGIAPLCELVVAMDICPEMLDQITPRKNIHMTLADIEQNYVMSGFFNKIISRMCFHHLLKDINGSFERCKKMLKPGGRLIITEAVPPSDDKKVVRWWTKMFAIKEDRLVFTQKDLETYFLKHGFEDIKVKVVVTKMFDIGDWITKQGLSLAKQIGIADMHLKAPKYVKEAHKMKFEGAKILIDSKNIIISGRRR